MRDRKVWGDRIRVVDREEYDTLIRQRAADLEALNAVQALHAQAVAERDEARRQVEAMREVVDLVIRAQDAVDVGRPEGFALYCDAAEKARALAVPSTNGGG